VPRNYDASRRREAASRTREAILAAAFELHGRGELGLEALAAAANVSLATVRKHFPNRELLFEACTNYGLHLVPTPDPHAIASIEDPGERLAEAVTQAYRLHEALFGQVWAAYRLEDESPALAAALHQVEAVSAELAGSAVAGWPGSDASRGDLPRLVAGLLGPLTYRGLRVHGQLSPGAATGLVTTLLLQALERGHATAGEGVAGS
jgi:AcrR family transcriptional regulator